MELEAVQDAVRILEAQGVPLAEITSPMIREITGYGSYTSQSSPQHPGSSSFLVNQGWTAPLKALTCQGREET